MPLFLQINEQLRFLILSGKYPVGSLLPSIRELSDILQVNRNTIRNAVDILQAEGLVEVKQGVGITVKNTNNMEMNVGQIDNSLKEIAIAALSEARVNGFNCEELKAAIDVLDATMKTSPMQLSNKRYIIFVECNKITLESYKKDIEENIDVTVIPYLLDDFSEMNDVAKILLEGSECIVTTYSHFNEVKSIMEDSPKPVLVVTVSSYLDVMIKTSHWPKDAQMLLIVRQYGDKNIAKMLGHYHKSITTCGLDTSDYMEQISKAKYLIIQQNAYQSIKDLLQPDQQYVVLENKMDSASIQMLKNFMWK